MDVIKNINKIKNENNIILTLQKDYYLYKDLKPKQPIIQLLEITSQDSKRIPNIMEQYGHRKAQSNICEINSIDNKDIFEEDDDKSRNAQKNLINDNFIYATYTTSLNNNPELHKKKFPQKINNNNKNITDTYSINDNEKVISTKTNNEDDYDKSENFRKTEYIQKNRKNKVNKFSSLEKMRKKFDTIKMYNGLCKNRHKSNGTIFPPSKYGFNNANIVRFLNKIKSNNNSNTNSKKKQKTLLNKKNRFNANKQQKIHSEECKKSINVRFNGYNNEKLIFNALDKNLVNTKNFTIDDNPNNLTNNHNYIIKTNQISDNNHKIHQNSKYLYSIGGTTELPKISINDIKPLITTQDKRKLKYLRYNTFNLMNNEKQAKYPISLNKNKPVPQFNNSWNENDYENSNGCREIDVVKGNKNKDNLKEILDFEDRKSINNNHNESNISIDADKKDLNNTDDKMRRRTDKLINITNLNGTNNEYDEGIMNYIKSCQHLKSDYDKIITNNKIYHEYVAKYKNSENEYYNKHFKKVNKNLKSLFNKNTRKLKKMEIQKEVISFINNRYKSTLPKNNNNKKIHINNNDIKYEVIFKKKKYFKGFLEQTLISYFSFKILKNVNIHTIKIAYKEQVQFSNKYYFDILPLMVKKVSIDWRYPDNNNNMMFDKVNLLSLTKDSKYNFKLITQAKIIGGKSCNDPNIVEILKIFKNESSYLDLKQRKINRILTEDINNILNTDTKAIIKQKEYNNKQVGDRPRKHSTINRSCKRLKKRVSTVYSEKKVDMSLSSDKCFSVKNGNPEKSHRFSSRVFASCTKLQLKKFDSDENEETKEDVPQENIKYSKFKKSDKPKKDMAIILSSSKKITELNDKNDDNENNEIHLNNFFDTANKLDNLNLLANKHLFNQNKKVIKCGTIQKIFQQAIQDNKNELNIKQKLKNDTMIIKCAGYDMLTKEASLIKTQEIEKDLPIAKKFDKYAHFIKTGKIQMCLEMLKEEKSADVFNRQEISTGNTLLIFAVQYNMKSIVEELLARGSNPNIQNKFGNTALHLAYKNNHSIIINDLLMYYANEKIKNNKGLFPWQMSENLN